MKNLTELLKDIPLEEMTGGLNMGFSEENTTKTNVQNGKVKIKNRAPAAVAIAACAVVAVAGAIHYRGNDIPGPGASNDSTVTTDAEDCIEVTGAEDDTRDDTIKDTVVETKVDTDQLEKLPYDLHGYDYDLIKDYIQVLDQNNENTKYKINDDNIEMRVVSAKANYPFYDVDVVAWTKDGSPISDSDYFEAYNSRYTIVNDDLADELYNQTEGIVDEMVVYGNTATYTVHFALNNLLNEKYIINGNKLDMQFNFVGAKEKLGCETTITVDGMNPDSLNDFKIHTNEKGKWSFIDALEIFENELDYTVNAVDVTNAGVKVNMSTSKEFAASHDFFYLDIELGRYWHDDDYVAKYGQDNLYVDDGLNDELLITYNPNRDYDFIKLELDDGTVTNLKYTSSACMENSDGTITLCYNSMSTPFDASKVTAVHVGSVVIPVK